MAEPVLTGILKRWSRSGAGSQPDPGTEVVGRGVELLLQLERQLGSSSVSSPRSVVPADLGGLDGAAMMAAAGMRCALWTTEAELQGEYGVLEMAARRHLPLVIYAIAETATCAGDHGAVVLVPDDLTAAIDLALAARLIAETALTPVVVVLDRRTLAAGVQSCWYPSASLIVGLAGNAADEVHPPTAAQIQAFGQHRRRVPRRYDVGGARRLDFEHTPPLAAQLAAEQLFFASSLAELCDACMSKVAERTGRPLSAVVGPRVGRSETGVIAAGACAALAKVCREGGALRRHVPIAVMRLHPPPIEQLAELVGRRPAVVVEAVAQATGSGPVERGVSLAVGPAEGRVWLTPEGSRRAWELEAALAAAAPRGQTRVLGVGAGRPRDRRGDPYPKRSAVVAALRRDYPASAWHADLAAPSRERAQAGRLVLGLVGEGPAASTCNALTEAVARLLVDLGGGAVATAAPSLFAAGLHQVVWSADATATAGDQVLDLLGLLDAPSGVPSTVTVPHLIVGDDTVIEAVAWSSSHARVRAISGGDDPECRLERWIGALLAAGVAAGGLDPEVFSLRRAQSRRRAHHEAQPPTRRDQLVEALSEGFEASERSISLPKGPSLPADLAPVPTGDGLGAEAVAFWDQVGLLAAEGNGDDLLPVPVLALGEVPAEAGVLPRATMPTPVWSASQCTACGACWTMCPHSAIEVVATSPLALAQVAFERAATADPSLEGLRRFVPKLAAAAATRLGTAGGGELAPTLTAVGEEVLAAAGVQGDALDSGRAGVARLAAECGRLELAAPTALWHTRERSKRGSGRMLALAIDPDACRACALCVEVCEPLALQVGSAVAAAAGGRALAVRQLAASAAADVVAGDGEVMGSLEATLLQRRFQLLGGRDRAPAGEGTRLALRQILAAAAKAFEPARDEVVKAVEELERRLAAAIHEALAVALPDHDLDALAAGLETFSDDRPTELGDIAARVGAAIDAEGVDVRRVRRLVEAARAVADLRVRFAHPHHGRAPLSLVIAPSPALAWTNDFPLNPFRVPVVATAAPVAVADGLLAAELDRVRAEAAVLRRAGLELERSASTTPGADPVLGWESLSPLERGLIAPVLVVVDERRSDAAAVVGALVERQGPLVVTTLAAPGQDLAVVAQLCAQSSVVDPAGLFEAGQWLGRRVQEGGRAVLWRVAVASRVDCVDPSATLAATRTFVGEHFALGVQQAAPELDVQEPHPRDRHLDREIEAIEAAHRQALEAVEAEVKARLAERARARLREWLVRTPPGVTPS